MESNPSTTSRRALTAEQLGHLRHFDNLSRQLPNDWSLMQGKGVGQDDFGGYRFQLAYMAYALALTHVHRLPAAPGVFKATFQRLIEKILMPEVWMYWRDTSRGGAIFNMHLTEQLHEEWNPVVRDNIMYSAYVQSMALLYNYLFDDDRYAKAGALSFRHWSFFWGGAEKRFDYDQNSLNEHLYWQMVENGYLGIACEPNCIFQICNQPAILGFRMHDLISGGAVADEVTRSYEEAWKQFGRLDANGHYNTMMLADSKTLRPNEVKAPWVDAWCGTLMNMWNRDFVRANYPRQVRDLLVPGKDGALSVRSAPVMEVMGQRVVTDTCDFGWVAAWASEMGDTATLQGLLTHADRYMGPAWRNGGLYYPRNDIEADGEGNRTVVEPLTGNVLLGLARLNIPDGFWRLYNAPWDRSHFSEPALIDVASDIDVSEAFFDRSRRALTFTIQRKPDCSGDGVIMLGNIDETAAWNLPPGFAISRERDGILLRCPQDGEFHTIIATLR